MVLTLSLVPWSPVDRPVVPACLGCKLWVPSVRAGLGPCFAAAKEALPGAKDTGGLRGLWMHKKTMSTRQNTVWPCVQFGRSEEAVAFPGEGL